VWADIDGRPRSLWAIIETVTVAITRSEAIDLRATVYFHTFSWTVDFYMRCATEIVNRFDSVAAYTVALNCAIR